MITCSTLPSFLNGSKIMGSHFRRSNATSKEVSSTVLIGSYRKTWNCSTGASLGKIKLKSTCPIHIVNILVFLADLLSPKRSYKWNEATSSKSIESVSTFLPADRCKHQRYGSEFYARKTWRSVVWNGNLLFITTHRSYFLTDLKAFFRNAQH